eukprot:1135664-Rhodomonas_salina.1
MLLPYPGQNRPMLPPCPGQNRPATAYAATLSWSNRPMLLTVSWLKSADEGRCCYCSMVKVKEVVKVLCCYGVIGHLMLYHGQTRHGILLQGTSVLTQAYTAANARGQTPMPIVYPTRLFGTIVGVQCLVGR